MPEDLMEPVRVLDKDTKAHLTIRRISLPHGNYQVLKQDATDINGDFLPTEYLSDDASATTKEKS